MALTGVTLLSVVQESLDATEIRMWDESTWNGKVETVTGACVVISYYDINGTLVSFDPYYLITGGDDAKFDEYCDLNNGTIIKLEDLTIAGEAPPDRFPDGYYIVTLYVTDGSYGTYAAGGWLKYDNPQAFLAKSRFTTRKLPAIILSWPMTDDVRIKNRDMFLLRMYLDAAEDVADYGKLTEFLAILVLINSIFSYYKLEEVW
jgi:hypothetical protein